jgi:hypothetical protein
MLLIHSLSYLTTSGRTLPIVSLFLPYCFGETDFSFIGDNDPMLSVFLVAWPGFPAVNCQFQGIDTAVVMTNGIIKDSNITFLVSPP